MSFAPKGQLKIFCLVPGFFDCLFVLFVNPIEKKWFERYDGGVRGRVTNLSERPTLGAICQNSKMPRLTKRDDILDQSCRQLAKDWSFPHALLLSHKHSALVLVFVLSQTSN